MGLANGFVMGPVLALYMVPLWVLHDKMAKNNNNTILPLLPAKCNGTRHNVITCLSNG